MWSPLPEHGRESTEQADGWSEKNDKCKSGRGHRIRQENMKETVRYQSQSAQNDPDGQVCPTGTARPKWPIEVVGSGGEFQLDCPSPIEPVLVNAWNQSSFSKEVGMLPLEPVNTHTHTTRVPKTLTCTIHKVCHVQSISTGSNSHTHTTPVNPYMQHVTYSRCSTHTHTHGGDRTKVQVKFRS